MPFLGGLFSRKNKSSSRSRRDVATSSIHTSELGSARSSPTSYVTHDKSIPTYPNARNLFHPDSTHELPSNNVHPSMTTLSLPPPTSKKLRLPFARKKDALPRSDLSIASSPNVTSPKFDTSPRSSASSVPRANPEDLRRLRPPPSRSAIFAAYGDQTDGRSTHSLPDEASVVSEPSLPFPSSSPSSQSSKRTPLFPWSKASPQKSSPLGDSTLQTKSFLGPIPPTLDPANSFNLKSFRHIRAPSPTHSNTSNVSLTTPIVRLRPRGESINSESSQRISVAAFREAQARRSLAGSPSPSFRAPSPVPVLPLQTSSPPQAVQLQNNIHPRGRHSSMALYTSDSDSSTSSDDEDETIKRRPGLNSYEKNKEKAKSEMGHRSVVDDYVVPDSATPQRAPKSHSGHSRQSSGQVKPGISGNGLDTYPRSQPSLGHCTPTPKLQSSVLTTASSPSPTTKLSGTQVAPAPNLDISGTVKPSREPPLSTHSNSQNTTLTVPQKSNSSSDFEDDSEDDAPLATLVGPKRPGSAVSSCSSLQARSTGNVTNRSTRSSTLGPAKPLIDINELTGPKRLFTTPAEKSAAGFTEGPTLLSGAKRPISPPSLFTENPSNLNQPLTRKAPPGKFISPPSSSAIEVRQPILDTVDGADSTARSDPITFPSASPEQPRDALIERLSRAVNTKFIPNAVGPNIPKAKNSVPNQSESLKMDAGTGDTLNSSRQLRSERRDAPTKEIRVQSSAEKPTSVPVPKVNHSPPDEDLAQLLGMAGIKFMFGSNGAIPDQSSESESEDEDEDSYVQVKKEEVASAGNMIAPIPIKQRPPATSFSVTSRPPFPRRDSTTAAQDDATKVDVTRLSTASNAVAPRPRSITLTPSSTTSTSFHKLSANDDVIPSALSNVPSKSTSNIAPPKVKSDALKPPNVRQRSSTMITGVPLSVQASKAIHPERPFAVRRNSPASSTGDSSSSRAPVTPRDGSEIGIQDRKRDEWSGDVSVKQHFKRRSVSFEEDNLNSKPSGIPHSKGKGHTNSNTAVNDEVREARRKERRRTEAKAAIELGNVINGPAPIVDDEDDISMNHNINPRISTLNPMVGMGMGLTMPMQMGFGSPNPVAWGGSMAQPMHSPSPYMMPPPADPNFLAAHQHAMMYAKQAYQMAVAQQAMAAAGDEWERGSTVGGYGGSGMLTSTGPGMMSPHFGMIPMGQGYGWPSPSSVYLPSSSRSMYGGGSGGSIINSRNEYGGSRNPNNWSSSRSSYGESFGPPLDQYGRKNTQNLGHAQRDSVSSLRAPVMLAAQSQTGRGSPVRSGNGQRDSAYLPSVPPMPASQSQSERGSPDGTPRPRTGSQPATPSRGTYGRKIPPPSSWKAGM